MKSPKIVLMLAVVVVLALIVATSAYGGQAKVDVCHVTATHDFGLGPVAIGHVIRIAEPAYPTHIAHGDPPAWEMVTLPGGSEVCTAKTPARIVFVTSAGVVGRSLGGLAGADQTCQNLAQNAWLTGVYKAWLSAAGAGNSAAERLAHATGPYKLVNGTIVADNWDDLVDGSLQAPIMLDERGECGDSGYPVESCQYNGIGVWTSTNPDGSYNTAVTDCNNWNIPDPSDLMGGWGGSNATDGTWTADSSYWCNGSARLYCFQQ